MNDDTFTVSGLDHLVLCVQDVARTRGFYERVLGMESREERPGKWSLHFGSHKISLQHATAAPSIARRHRAGQRELLPPQQPAGG